MKYKEDPFFRALQEIEPDYMDTAMGPAYTITRAAAILRINPRAFSAWLNGLHSFAGLGQWNHIDFALASVIKGSTPRFVVPQVTVYEIKKAIERGQRSSRPALNSDPSGPATPAPGA